LEWNLFLEEKIYFTPIGVEFVFRRGNIFTPIGGEFVKRRGNVIYLILEI
jgi:hypothetical protein